MKLYRGKIPAIATELVEGLTKDQHIEVENSEEVRLDFESILKEFVRREREIVDEAKTRMERNSIGYHLLGRVISQVAKDRGFPQSDERLPYLVDQLLTMLFHSNNVAEIFADDPVLRKIITATIRRHTDMESELDREVRSKIKNLQEGTASFEIEYEKVMAQIKKRKRLE